MREEAWGKAKGSCMMDRAKEHPSGRTGPAMEKVCKTPHLKKKDSKGVCLPSVSPQEAD